MDIRYYVINLAEKEERWNRMVRLSKENGVTLTRVEAFSPSTIPIKSAFSEIFNCYLSPQQLGCYFSHRRIWEKIAKGSSPFAVVLEDDAVFSEDLVSFVDEVKKASINFDIIRLEDTYKGTSFITDSKLVQVGGIDLGRLYSSSAGTGGMIVSKEGAKKLLEIARPVLPVDELLFNKYSPIWNQLINYQVKQILVWQLYSLGFGSIKCF